jgi:hypothetical protein
MVDLAQLRRTIEKATDLGAVVAPTVPWLLEVERDLKELASLKAGAPVSAASA